MNKNQVSAILKKIHLDNAKDYFKTEEFEKWVEDTWKFIQEVRKE